MAKAHHGTNTFLKEKQTVPDGQARLEITEREGKRSSTSLLDTRIIEERECPRREHKGKPDAGNLHVRFDEGVGLRPHPTLLVKLSSLKLQAANVLHFG